MTNPWFDIAFNTARLAFESQQVMVLRGVRIAAGGASGDREARRMVSEKVSAFAEASLAATLAMASGKDPAAVTRDLLRRYRGHVRANARRLSR